MKADTDSEANKTELTKSKKATASKAPKKKPDIERDDCGNRVGSQAAKINAALSKKPKSAETLAKDTGLGLGRVRAHLKWLEGRGLTVTSETGVALK